jgi:uncharacterized protein (DUF58 family)
MKVLNENQDVTAGSTTPPDESIGIDGASKSRSIFSEAFHMLTRDRLFPFSLRITREGILFLVAVFILSFVAIRTGNNMMFMILAAMLAMIAVSGIVSRNALRQISLSMQLPENVFVGEKVSIKISMTNLKRVFPSFSIGVEDPELQRRHSPFRFLRKIFSNNPDHSNNGSADRTMLRQAAYFPILPPGEPQTELTIQSFPHRGLYCLHGFWISTRFPFGFFHRGRLVKATGEVLVYPLIPDISILFRTLPFLSGTIESLHPGQGENLFSIRKYQQTEDARTIDWKATAKTGGLMSREFAREEEIRICLILDTTIHSTEGRNSSEHFEKAVSFSAGIVAHFLEEGAGIEFLTPYEYIPRGTGAEHLYRILRSLAVVQQTPAPASIAWTPSSFSAGGDNRKREQIFSDKVFKVIVTPNSRGSFPSAIWRSSHVVFFDEL